MRKSGDEAVIEVEKKRKDERLRKGKELQTKALERKEKKRSKMMEEIMEDLLKKVVEEWEWKVEVEEEIYKDRDREDMRESGVWIVNKRYGSRKNKYKKKEKVRNRTGEEIDRVGGKVDLNNGVRKKQKAKRRVVKGEIEEMETEGEDPIRKVVKKLS